MVCFPSYGLTNRVLAQRAENSPGTAGIDPEAGGTNASRGSGNWVYGILESRAESEARRLLFHSNHGPEDTHLAA